MKQDPGLGAPMNRRLPLPPNPLQNRSRANNRVHARIMSSDGPDQHLPDYDFDPEKLTLRLQVTLAADKSAIDAVVQQVMDTIRQTKCADGKEDAIELALHEALANAVVHGA